jgi:polysaccharide export outer membrane protein
MGVGGGGSGGGQARGAVARYIQTLFEKGTLGRLTDAELLERFVARRDDVAEHAFSALIERHGPMVLRVCRRVLTDAHDAQDAFQATFLVLIRKASSVRRRDSLASWLHGIALRAAAGVRTAEARRRFHEQRCGDRGANAGFVSSEPDLGSVLHEELARLPEQYRAPMVLCYLEGVGCEEAAHRLGWPVGTVKSRLARGRARLRSRLARRGLAPSATFVSAALAAERATASVPATLEWATARAAAAVVTGYAASAGVVPASAAQLTEGVVKTMFWSNLNRIGAAVLALSLAWVCAVALMRQTEHGAQAAPPQKRAKVAPAAYIVEPPDFILVEVLEALPGRPISGARLVRPDGTISLGFYGDVHVAGLNLREVKEKVIHLLVKHLTEEQLGLVEPDPEDPGHAKPVAPADSSRVYVDLETCNSKFYYVVGQVQLPGRFPCTGRETVLDAINFAGGLIPRTKASELRLVRPPPPGARGQQVWKVDYSRIVNEGDHTTNYQLLPGDQLIVPRDPKAQPGPDAAAPAPDASDLRALEGRLVDVERKLDRLIELMEHSTPAAASKGKCP